VKGGRRGRFPRMKRRWNGKGRTSVFVKGKWQNPIRAMKGGKGEK